MKKLTLSQRYTTAVTLLKNLVEKYEAQFIDSVPVKNDWLAEKYEIRKIVRAIKSEYTNFISDKSPDDSDSIINLEYASAYNATAYGQPKGKNLANNGSTPIIYFNSMNSLLARLHAIEKCISSSNAHADMQARHPNIVLNPILLKIDYLDGWTTPLENGSIYAYGETESGEIVSKDSKKTMDDVAIIPVQYCLAQNFERLRRCFVQNIEHRTIPAVHTIYGFEPDSDTTDYTTALNNLKQHPILANPNAVQRPLSQQLNQLIATIEKKQMEKSSDSYREDHTIILEDTRQLLDMAPTATPEDRKAACANFQEKALLLQGHPQVDMQLFGGILMAIGVLLLALPFIVGAVMIGAGVGGVIVGTLGASFFFSSKQEGLSEEASNLALAMEQDEAFEPSPQ